MKITISGQYYVSGVAAAKAANGIEVDPKTSTWEVADGTEMHRAWTIWTEPKPVAPRPVATQRWVANTPEWVKKDPTGEFDEDYRPQRQTSRRTWGYSRTYKRC